MPGLVGRVPVLVRVGVLVVIAVPTSWFLVSWKAGTSAPFIDVATGVAAVWTCAAAVVVGWQAVMTRKAVQAAKESADLSRELISEGVKSRLDSRAPSTTLEMQDPAMWPPYVLAAAGETAQRISFPRQYDMPKDADQQIQVRAYVWLWNHSAKPLVATLSNLVPESWDEHGQSPSTVTVRPGEYAPLFVIETRSVADWIAAHDDRQNGGSAYRTLAEVSIDDGFDDGVIDRWTAELAGSPLRPVQGRGSTWEVLPEPNGDPSGREIVNCVVTGVERIYFLSKGRDVRLSALTEPGAST